MKLGRVALLMVIAVFGAVFITAPDASAAEIHEIPLEVDVEFNCNFYELNFKSDSKFDASYVVTYDAFGILRDEVGSIDIGIINVPQPDEWYVEFSPDDVRLCKTVYITQNISKGDYTMEYVMKVNIIPPPPEGENYKVTYYDGYTGTENPYYVEEIKSDRYSEVGKNFLYPPEPPIRVGYSFIGWFTDVDRNILLDPKEPVASNMNVFAKWVYSGIPDPDDPGSAPSPDAIAQSLVLMGDFKTEYVVGDYLNTTGLTVMANYSDGTSFEVTHLCVFTPTKFTEAGTVTVSVATLGLVTTFDVDVNETYVQEEGSDLTDYLLIAVILLLIVLIVVAVIRRKN